MKNVMAWVIPNTILWGCVYLGVFKGISGVDNIAVFMVWFMAVISLFLGTDKALKNYMEDKHPIPQWFDVSFDLTIVFMLLWSGYIWAGSAYVFHMFMLDGLHTRAKEHTTKKGD